MKFHKVFCSIVDVKVAHVSDVSFVQSLLHKSIVPRSKKLPFIIHWIQFWNLKISALISSALIFVAILQKQWKFWKMLLINTNFFLQPALVKTGWPSAYVKNGLWYPSMNIKITSLNYHIYKLNIYESSMLHLTERYCCVTPVFMLY